MDAKKITFILGGLAKGGAERVVSNLSNQFIEKGYDVHIITLLTDSIEYDLNPKVKVINLSKNNIAYYKLILFWIKNLHKYFLENSDRKVISFFIKINLIAIVASSFTKVKLIVSERTDPFSDGRSSFLNFLSYVLYKKCNYVVYQTEELASFFYKYFKKRTVVIPNPVVIKEYLCNQEPKENIIVSVGNLKEAKNYFMLIEAINRIKDRLDGYKVIIYGEGILRRDLENKIKSYNLENTIFLPGSINDVQEKIYKARLFVLTSNYEGMSNALQEAMALGLCCIATDCLGTKEIIMNNESGFIIKKNDDCDLANKIIYLISDDETRKKLGYQAFNYSKKYSIENVIAKWEKIL